jgi:hypothetical protein
MKTKAPQFELPTVGPEVFNLVVETAADGERLRREREAAAQTLRDTREREQQQQPALL